MSLGQPVAVEDLLPAYKMPINAKNLVKVQFRKDRRDKFREMLLGVKGSETM